MLIFDEYGNTVVLDTLATAVAVTCTSFWCLDTDQNDFMLQPLQVIEEIVGPTFTVTIGGFSFDVPANWFVLIADPTTKQMDVVNLANSSGTRFDAFYYGPNTKKHGQVGFYLTNYKNNGVVISPLLNKHQMLCHPVSPDFWICISPHDTYKNMKDMIVGDLIY